MSEHRYVEHERLSRSGPCGVFEQMMGQLRHGEDVDQIEEQLQAPYRIPAARRLLPGLVD
jgi:hypothetical protein